MILFRRPALYFGCFALLWLARPAAADGEATLGKPWEHASIDLETGLLWQVGTGTPLSYRLVPTQLSWRSPEAFFLGEYKGTRFLIRHRFTLIGTWIQQGPESHYIAIDGSPSIEWWNAAGTWALVGGAGGGLGLLDSQAVKGAQGQDFTLNWFARGAIEHVLRSGRRMSAGIMFQHMSNGGQTKPNPGIDSVGFTIGYHWSR